MATRSATGTRFSDSAEKRAKVSRETAVLWKLAKAAIRIVDSSRQIGRGQYEIPPEAMIALKHHCDEMRFPLKMMELEVMKEGENDE